MLADKNFIVIHHSDTKDTGSVSWGAIRRYHIETNGWKSIGYQYGIEKVDDRYEILVGRDLDETAAAVKEAQMNKRAVHICVVGDFDDAPPPSEQYRELIRLLKTLMRVLKVDANAIDFHRTFAVAPGSSTPYKSCPGDAFPSIEQVRFDASR